MPTIRHALCAIGYGCTGAAAGFGLATCLAVQLEIVLEDLGAIAPTRGVGVWVGYEYTTQVFVAMFLVPITLNVVLFWTVVFAHTQSREVWEV